MMNEHDLAGVRTTTELVREARKNLDQFNWDYLSGGGETETTLLRNRQSIDEIGFRPRVLVDVQEANLKSTFLGQDTTLPIFLAPIGGLNRIDPQGALAPLKAAEQFGIGGFLSSVTQPAFDVVRNKVASPLVYQLYVHGDQSFVDDRLDQVTEAGYTGFCITADTARYGRRERDLIKHYNPRSRNRETMTEAGFQSAFDWKQLERVRARCKLPLILKGIATAEDATLAIEHGVDVIYISNHGGRQLDHGRGTIEVLPEVVDAVQGNAEIYIDGGFVRGTDVLKALALGAQAVGIGKLYGWATAAASQAGVERMLAILEEEMLNSLSNIGVDDIAKLTAQHLCAVRPVRPPSAFSAFPLLELPDYKY